MVGDAEFAQPLPPGWASGEDSEGRTFYIDHTNQVGDLSGCISCQSVASAHQLTNGWFTLYRRMSMSSFRCSSLTLCTINRWHRRNNVDTPRKIAAVKLSQ